MVARARAVPAWAWLTALVLASILFRWWIGRGMVGPFIMVDELIYSELARSLADGHWLLVRGESSGVTSILYPLLIAPAYALYDSLPDAYGAVKAINAVLMSAAAIPAYFLARRLLAPGLSLLAALLTVAIPSLAYTGTVMTENAFYPVFLTVALALVLVLERPTAWRQVALLGLCGVAVLIRFQGLALVLAALSAPLVLWLIARRPLRPYRVLYGIVAGGAVLLLVLQLARGSSLSSLLGAYAVVGETGYDLSRVAEFLLWHLAELDLYLGVFPLVAFVLLLARGRSLDPAAQAFLAATAAMAVWVLIVVAAFASQFAANRIQERNMFFLVPLFLVALLVWIDRRAPRPRAVAVAAALTAGVLPALIPYETFIETGARSDTLMLLPLWNLQDRITLPRVDEVVLLVGLAAAAAFLLLPRRYALALPLVVLLYFGLAFRPITLGPHGLRVASEGAVFTGIGAAQRDWIDRAVPKGAEVAMLWTGRTDRFTVNLNEFFNRSVGSIYTLRGPVPGNLPETPVTIDPATGEVRREDGSVVRERYALTDGSIAPEGDRIALDLRLGLTVYRTGGELVSTTTVEGLYDDQWSGPEVRYRRLRCRGGSLLVGLVSDPSLFQEPQTITATSGGRVFVDRIEPLSIGRFTVPLVPEGGACTVRFTIAPTAVPGDGDDRELGTHFRFFEYSAP